MPPIGRKDPSGEGGDGMSLDHDHAAAMKSELHHERQTQADGRASDRRPTMQTPILTIESMLRDGQTLADYGHEHPRPPHGWRAVVGHFAWRRGHPTTASRPPSCLPGKRPGCKPSHSRR
jgi:hypothetical protein